MCRNLFNENDFKQSYGISDNVLKYMDKTVCGGCIIDDCAIRDIVQDNILSSDKIIELFYNKITKECRNKIII